jgi:hypothetical protein
MSHRDGGVNRNFVDLPFQSVVDPMSLSPTPENNCSPKRPGTSFQRLACSAGTLATHQPYCGRPILLYVKCEVNPPEVPDEEVTEKGGVQGKAPGTTRAVKLSASTRDHECHGRPV